MSRSPGSSACWRFAQVVARAPRSTRARRPVARRHAGARGARTRGDAGDDRQVRLVHAAELVRVRRGRERASAAGAARSSSVYCCVAMSPRRVPSASRTSASTRARERRVHPDRQRTRVGARAVVDVVLAAERGRDRKFDASPKAITSAPACALQPPPPTTISGRSAPARSSSARWTSAADGAAARLGTARVATSASSNSTSSGSAITTGPGRPESRRRERARDVAPGCDRRRPPAPSTSSSSRTCAGSRAPGTRRDRGGPRHLADEEDHRRRVLVGRVHAGRRVVGPGPRVTKQMPGLPVSLP